MAYKASLFGNFFTNTLMQMPTFCINNQLEDVILYVTS